MATFAAYNCNAKVLHVDGEFVIQWKLYATVTVVALLLIG